MQAMFLKISYSTIFFWLQYSRTYQNKIIYLSILLSICSSISLLVCLSQQSPQFHSHTPSLKTPNLAFPHVFNQCQCITFHPLIHPTLNTNCLQPIPHLWYTPFPLLLHKIGAALAAQQQKMKYFAIMMIYNSIYGKNAVPSPQIFTSI